eukprot:6271217-Prymnesium_polylepis.2
MATALTEKNRSDSFEICMKTTTFHAYFEGHPTNHLRLSCGCANVDIKWSAPLGSPLAPTRGLCNVLGRFGYVGG